MSGNRDRPFSILTDRMPTSQLTTYILATTLLAVVVHTAIRIAQLIIKRLRDTRALRDFGGPKPHWLVGNLGQMGKIDDVLNNQIELSETYPKACKFQIGQIMQLKVYHPDTVKCILTAEPKDPFSYHFLVPWLGDGLLVSKGHKWARNRRLLTPAFHFDILKPYVTVFSHSVVTMVQKWHRMQKNATESVELFEHVSLMTLDSLMKCIFGCQEDCQKDGFRHPYIQGVYELTELISKRFRFLPHHNDFLFWCSWNGYKFRRACSVVHTYSRQVIKQRREERHATDNKKQPSEKKYLDFLDMLVSAKDEDGQGLTDKEIQAEVDTFMFEGHDTTASGISWCLYNLARHPEYQAKCREEISRVMDDKEHFTWDDLQHLPFLTMCIKESLRLHPPVPNVARMTTKPVTFPDGRTIPDGIWVNINIYATHRSADFWENPTVYDPYRFTPENMKGRPPHAYIPFSAGPRNCIGQHFALSEIKVSVAQVIRNFALTEDPINIPKAIPRLVLRSSNGLYVKVTPLNK